MVAFNVTEENITDEIETEIFVTTEILHRFWKHDEEALKIVYDTYYHGVFYITSCIVKDYETARELAQDTFVKIWFYKKPVHTEIHFRRLLYIICRNTCFDYLRKQKISIIRLNDYDIYQYGYANEIKNIDMEIDFSSVLNECEKKIMVAAFIHGLSKKEISEYLGLPIGTVMSYYSRGLKKLKKYYENEDVYYNANEKYE